MSWPEYCPAILVCYPLLTVWKKIEEGRKKRRKPVEIATAVIPALCDLEADGAPVPGSGSLGYTVRPYLKNKPTKDVLGDELCYPVTL